MAEVSKTAKRSAGAKVIKKRPCKNCGGDTSVLQYAGFGKHGFYWVCQGGEKKPSCGFEEPTR